MLMGAFQGIQGGDGDGRMITPFKGQEMKEEAPDGPLGGDNPEDAPGTWVGARGRGAIPRHLIVLYGSPTHGTFWGDSPPSGGLDSEFRQQHQVGGWLGPFLCPPLTENPFLPLLLNPQRNHRGRKRLQQENHILI